MALLILMLAVIGVNGHQITSTCSLKVKELTITDQLSCGTLYAYQVA